MNDDQDFDHAFRALRESTDGSAAFASRTRQKILARVEEQRAQGRRRRWVALPFAAAFVVSAAWGAVTGRLPPWLAPMLGGDPPSPPTTLGVGGAKSVEPSLPKAPPVASAPGTAEPASAEPTSAEPTSDDVPKAGADAAMPAVPELNPTTEPRRVPSGARAITVPSASAAREEDLYEAAHRAHFVDRDPGRALPSWDAYLAEYPTGRFALEARYNRAIALIRLGRRAEGRAELLPFAGKEAGGYRQAEARELLDALAVADGAP